MFREIQSHGIVTVRRILVCGNAGFVNLRHMAQECRPHVFVFAGNETHPIYGNFSGEEESDTSVAIICGNKISFVIQHECFFKDQSHGNSL